MSQYENFAARGQDPRQPSKRRNRDARSGRPKPSQEPCWKKLVCIKSKAAVVILAGNIVVANIFSSALMGSVILPVAARNAATHFSVVVCVVLAVHCILAIIKTLYPLGGFLADVHFGRYRVIAVSLLVFLCGIGIESIAVKIAASHFPRIMVHLASLGPLSVVGFLLFVIGFSGYQANIVQFGLDQLQEAPSEELSVFLHLFVWTETIGQALMTIVVAVVSCHKNTEAVGKLVSFQPEFTLVSLTCIICLSYNKKEWFYMEPEVLNPYRMVFRVLKFAKQNKYPIQRSAFAYNEEEQPSRIDFAKVKYGGPFQTEQVEDVKTFFRILALLCCIGLIFIADATIKMFPLYAIHSSGLVNTGCTARWMLEQSGILTYLLTIIAIPFHIVVAYSYFRKRVPSILTRLNFGIFLTVLSVISMLLTDAIGHVTSSNEAQHCVWTTDIRNNRSTLGIGRDSTLHLPSSLLLIPNILIGLGPPLVYITALEFISAQSPHTMKGLLFGMFYAVKGLYELIGTALLYPFVIVHNINTFPISCGTIYYLLIATIVVAGLVLYWVAVRRYKYRQREEEPYNRMYVERYFEQSGVEEEESGNLQTSNQAMQDYLNNTDNYNIV